MKFIFLLFYNFVEDNFHLKKIKNYLRKKIFLSKPIIFDVGSHKGKIAKLFRDIYSEGTIHCFDPNSAFREDLKKLGKNVKIHNFALGDKVEKRKILFNDLDLTTSLSEINKHSIYLKVKNLIINKPQEKKLHEININTLENFCVENNIREIDLLKIDVEGYELKVLLGAKSIIKNVKFIIIEIQKNDMYQNYSKDKIDDFLKKNGFKLIKSFNFPFMFFQDNLYKKS